MALGDYHLTYKEQEQIERIIPMHQAKIHMAFRATLIYESTRHERGAVALSEHLIVFCSRSRLFKSLKPLGQLHVGSIRLLESLDDRIVCIIGGNIVVTIIAAPAMRLARNLLRNYLLSFPLLPPPLRFKFVAHDPRHFPPFNPKLSPSQQFQFTYNANCSYYEATYYHDIPRYFHHQVSTANGIFDLIQLPLHILESGLGGGADVRTIMASLGFCPFVQGITCENITIPELFRASATLVLFNSYLRILRFVRTEAEGGGVELANAMLKNPKSRITYWDLSENHLSDIGSVLRAFREYRGEVNSLSLTNCDIGGLEMTVLLTSLAGNSGLHGMRQLRLSGNKMTTSHCSQLCEFLSFANRRALECLELGPLAKTDIILRELELESSKLRVLKIVDSQIGDGLGRIARPLRELDIRGCQLSDSALLGLVESLDGSDPSVKMTLGFGGLKLREKRLSQWVIAMNRSPTLLQKISALLLDDNGMGVKDLQRAIPVLQSMPNLEHLSLSGNFTGRMTGIPDELLRCARLASLGTFCVRGSHSCKLGHQVVAFVNGLTGNENIKNLDISFNRIGGHGLRAVANLLNHNPNLTAIYVDGAEPKSIEPILEFLNAVVIHDRLMQVPYPIDDIYDCAGKMGDESRARTFHTLAQLQADVESRLRRNRAAQNVFSPLQLLNDPVLSDIIDTITLDLQGRLQNVNLTEHSAITEVVGLPLPYEAVEPSVQGVRQSIQEEEGADMYVGSEMMTKVTEPDDSNLENMRTLMFNSMLIRRPDAEHRFKAKNEFLLRLKAPSAIDERRTGLVDGQLEELLIPPAEQPEASGPA
jgi:hypothetical protein